MGQSWPAGHKLSITAVWYVPLQSAEELLTLWKHVRVMVADSISIINHISSNTISATLLKREDRWETQM